MKTLNNYLTEAGVIRRGMKLGGMKYELTDKSMDYRGFTLHRIRALMNFETVDGGKVRAGDQGGWIEKENLSQTGRCWVDSGSCAYDNAQVRDNAFVFSDSEVCDSAQVYGDAQVYDSARVYDNAQVYGNAQVHNRTTIFGNARVYGRADIDYDVNKGNHC